MKREFRVKVEGGRSLFGIEMGVGEYRFFKFWFLVNKVGSVDLVSWFGRMGFLENGLKEVKV